MNLNDHMKWWSHASVKIMDIRSGSLPAGSEIPHYRLPSSAFLYAVQGQALVHLDELRVTLGRNQLAHGGRGAVLAVRAEEAFEYLLVLYKAVLMLPPSSIVMHLERENPTRLQYTFGPSYPVELLTRLEQMHSGWLTADPLQHIYVRSLFLQFVHELLWQMKQQGIQPVQPDLLVQVLRYMEEHYREQLTLVTLAERFDCSVSFLSKLFSSRLQASPIRVLTRIRMDKAAHDLLHTELSLQEIAERTGYPDAHTFSRNFKRQFGMPPVQFKLKFRTEDGVRELPAAYPRIALVDPEPGCYSNPRAENHYHSYLKGGLPVLKRNRGASLAAAALFICVTLLLSACSGAATPANGSVNGSPSAQPTAAASQDTAGSSTDAGQAAAATKIYRDSNGDVTIPANPQRIIDLTGSAIGNLLVLGVKPVAAADDSLKNPFHEGRLDHIVNIGKDPNAEAILKLDPDLILMFDYMEDAQYEQLSKIAPVVRLKYGGGTPQDLLLEFGKITGKEAEAQQWIDSWNAKIAEVKPKIAEVVGDKTVSILQPYAKGIYAWGDKGGRGGEILYRDLGLKAPEIVRTTLIDGEGFGGDLSLELLPEYAGDYIFTSNWGWDDGDANVVYDSEIWKSLPAVKNGQVYFIDEKGSFYNDPISLEAQLDFITKSLLKTAP
ncbi:ABC transporter substrate-binding protein [Paenibacillus piscarius]|uniref:ABC transporter substrate-binding protein n=1 Tax=Paenibacillus piscarius TaxID=1089681 RepID=UPI001EE9669C|nr:ABC transporter substrate-binding protein [Paenibacillus piscarius]